MIRMRQAAGAAAAAFCLSAVNTQASTPAAGLVPLPTEIRPENGLFTPTAITNVLVDPADPAAVTAADMLIGQAGPIAGATLRRSSGVRAVAGTILLRLDPTAPVVQHEGYSLDVDADGMVVRARDEAGLFYGAMTAAQLLSAGAVPAMRIRDWPRFGWRGVMIDSARHMQSPADLKAMLDAMAALKLNVLHWHLTDDQGWRLEIKHYPRLTSVGAWRRAAFSGLDGDGAPYGGFYTQDQVRDLVAYAAARHITIVPEIDMPGHQQAAIAAYPELGSTSEPVAVSTLNGVNPYLLNADPSTLAFAETVLDEVMDLFPSSFIHIGGDEAVKRQWRDSPRIQQRIRDLGLNGEDALQSWFISQLAQYLTSHGRRPIGWDEILQGGLPASASVMSWHGVEGGITAARAGHDAVLAPSPTLYLNFAQSDRADEPTGSRYPVQSLDTVYHFDPLPPGSSAVVQQHMLGIEAPIWTNFINSARMVEYAAFPRLDAFAEIAWTPSTGQDWNGFLNRLPAEVARQRKQRLQVADSAYAVSASVSPAGDGRLVATLFNQLRSGIIRYTLDGSTPTTASPAYRQALMLPAGTVIAAATFSDSGIALATPRRITIVLSNPGERTNATLAACPGEHVTLHVPALPDQASSPLFRIDFPHDCAFFPQAPTAAASEAKVDLVPIARSFTATPKLVGPPVVEPAGNTLSIREDDCKGTELAVLALPADTKPGTPLRLQLHLPGLGGPHSLCFTASARTDSPYYAFADVVFQPAQVVTHSGSRPTRPLP